MRLLFDREAEGTVQDSVKVCLWEDPGGRISMELPEGFGEMGEKNREKAYPYEGRPEIIWEDAHSDAQMTLQFLDRELKKEDTRDAIHQVCAVTENAFPQYKRSPEYLYESGSIPVGWFLLSMEDMGKEHIKAVFSANGEMSLLTVTYPEKEKDKWRPLFKYIFASINVWRGNPGEEDSYGTDVNG